MVTLTDPPSAERKRAKRWARLSRFCRMLVNRRTLLIAVRIVNLTTRIAQIVNQMFGDF